LNRSRLIFESYNMTIEGSYNRLFENRYEIDGIDPLGLEEEDIAEFIKNDLIKWEDMPLKELNGETPSEFFAEITEFDKAVELFKQAAMLCDKDIPELFLDSFRGFGDKTIQALLSIASDKHLINSDEKFLIPLMSIRVLGIWGDDSAVIPMINLLSELSNNSQSIDSNIIPEEIKEALIKIGKPSVKPVIDSIESSADFDEVCESLMFVLTQIGRDNKTDEIFKCLKRSFLRIKNKAYGAIYLGDYGDWRAISVLRGYVEKNKVTIDHETFYEIKSAVERLGGDMNDLSL
jgi:hypothetical protein